MQKNMNFIYISMMMFIFTATLFSQPLSIPSEKKYPILTSKGSWKPVVRETLKKTVPSIGSFYPNQVTKIGPQINSRIQKILVDVGDEVKAKQELVILEATFFKIELKQQETEKLMMQSRIQSMQQSIQTLQKEIALAKSTLEDSNLQLTRMKNLWEKPKGTAPSIPQKNYDDAVFQQRQASITVALQESRLMEATIKLEEMQYALQQVENGILYAQERLNETILYAPYDGIISKRLADTGEIVTSAPIVHILEIQEVSTVRLEFTLPQYMMGQIKKGTIVEFEMEGIPESQTKSEIVSFYPSLDESTRSLRCRVLVKNPEYKFKPGALIPVHIVLYEKNKIITVPRKAISEIQNFSAKLIVFEKEAGKDIPKERLVQIGLIGEDKVEIVEGLKEGENIWVAE